MTFVAPRTETEKTLAAIWLELLKLDQIGVNDSFFELGGHSLLAIRAVSRIRDLFEVDLPAQILFENSTIAELAPLLANSEDKPEVFPANVTRIPRRTQAGPYPLSAAQEQLWFLSQLAPGSAAYNMVDLIPLAGDYDAEALRRTIGEMVRRHEILRTAFSSHSGQPMQDVVPALDSGDFGSRFERAAGGGAGARMAARGTRRGAQTLRPVPAAAVSLHRHSSLRPGAQAVSGHPPHHCRRVGDGADSQGSLPAVCGVLARPVGFACGAADSICRCCLLAAGVAAQRRVAEAAGVLEERAGGSSGGFWSWPRTSRVRRGRVSVARPSCFTCRRSCCRG